MAESDTPPKNKPASPLSRSFMKGLTIVLPAIITIALFAWVWGLLSTNVVVLIIKGLDTPKIFAPRDLREGEVLPPDIRIVNGEYSRIPLVAETKDEYRGLSPLGRRRSINQAVLDAWSQSREYDDQGRVTSYSWMEYLLASIIGLVLVVLLGWGTRNFFGRRLVQLFEWFVNRTPFIKAVYPHAKQLVDFFFSDEKQPLEFDTVVTVEFPKEGAWSLGFVTGSGFKTLQEKTGKRYATVYVPTTPAPMTGFTVLYPVEEVVRLDMSVEDAMKFVISGGVLTAPSELVRPASGAHYNLTHKMDEQVRERKVRLETRSLKKMMQEEGARDKDGVREKETAQHEKDTTPPAPPADPGKA
ncbi:MAG: DUF502 domain-containing protein [Planctomycetes bacterium]|nr:DUF502 domain-containing protein [Planctomycetota bacterium]